MTGERRRTRSRMAGDLERHSSSSCPRASPITSVVASGPSPTQQVAYALHRRPFGSIVNFSGRFARDLKNSLVYGQICLPVVFLFHPPKRAWVSAPKPSPAQVTPTPPVVEARARPRLPGTRRASRKFVLKRFGRPTCRFRL